ncbi:hypothetical protein LTV02_25930 [Nocardia yamanashiensis]|uniref:hypothetical protein n=1 Tax=Nocardia yamanashiensis TaxID=209247 RepID=UPI001E3748CF|nr:hypothetical protein [Nocardia yamanashiensis]UGT39492.1 hypothetical protein LTV02_25930 [Nocardia yamanashiensis]
MDSGKDESADRSGPAVTPGADAGQPAGQPGTAAEGTGANGQSDSEFGPPLSEFGPSLNDFGPSMNELGTGGFGPAPDAGAPGWTPAPGAASPELAWRPADPGGNTPGSSGLAWRPAEPAESAAGANPEFGWQPADSGAANPNLAWQPADTPQVQPPPAQYRAPDSWTPQDAVGGYAPMAGENPAESGAGEANSPGGWDESAATTTGSWWRSTPSGFPPAPPVEAAEGESLSWADDPIAKRLAPKPAAAPVKPPGKPWGRIALIAGSAIAAVALVAVVIVAVTSGGDSDESPLAGATTAGKPGVSTTVAQLSCPAKRDGALTIGNGAGGTDSGAQAILGFQHGFYVDRSGVKARSFVDPETKAVSEAPVIQSEGIDKTPPGTSYCVRIVEVGPETYDADLTVHSPDGTTAVYRQRIVTVNRDGKHLISTIDERQS